MKKPVNFLVIIVISTNFALAMTRPPLWPVIIGTGFGSGFCPIAPGTAGALLATLIWVALSYAMPSAILIAVTAVLIVVSTAAGTWAAGKLAPYWGDDPSKVVIDEMAGVWVPLLAAPTGNLWWPLACFALFRFFDILKPLGIRALDQRKGPFWVMADDLAAGLYSLVIILLAQWAI